MKANKIEHGSHVKLFVLSVAALLLLVGGAICYDRLSDLYLEQCVITDMAAQVSITAGKMVKPGTIAEELGLKVGANLALIDFSQKRKDLLAKIPNLLSIRISRTLPDKVTITTEERVPIARLGVKGGTATTGKVVDSEGVVFVWQRGTQTLPTIREAPSAGSTKGKRVSGRTLAALRLVEACREPAYLELGLLEVDVTKRDFLLATLGNYSKAKFTWEDMDSQMTPASKADMNERLTNLTKVIRSRTAQDTVIWNATMPDYVFADTQEKL